MLIMTQTQSEIEKLRYDNSVLSQNSKQDQQIVEVKIERSDDEVVEDNCYTVEKILDSKIEKRKRYYLVKWKDYNDEHNSWEPKSNLHCTKISKEYNSI